MKFYLKRIFIFFKTLYYIISWLIHQIRFENFRNYYSIVSIKNKNIAILGNGPSLKNDLDKLENFSNYTFSVVNDFAITHQFNILKPLFYTLTDPAYFQEKILVKSNENALNSIALVNWDMFLFIPYISLNLLKKNRSEIFFNKFITIVPYHTSEFNINFWLQNILYKKGLSMPRPQNVIIACIFNAINLNFEKIFLLGVDHTWTNYLIVDEQNRVCFKNEHFYNSDNVSYKPFLNIWGIQYRMHEILFDYALMFKGYFEVARYAEEKKVKIINFTTNSNIDSFERLIVS
jgi:hypothetical protein